MSNESNQWIPLTGPGGRLPTIHDANEDGKVYFACREFATAQIDNWSNPETATHFCPIPKAPPLPKPVELSREEKDYAKAREIYLRKKTIPLEDIIEGIYYGRSDGRAQLAREALGLFKWCDVEKAAEVLANSYCSASAKALLAIRELLTKAAEEKP